MTSFRGQKVTAGHFLHPATSAMGHRVISSSWSRVKVMDKERDLEEHTPNRPACNGTAYRYCPVRRLLLGFGDSGRPRLGGCLVQNLTMRQQHGVISDILRQGVLEYVDLFCFCALLVEELELLRSNRCVLRLPEGLHTACKISSGTSRPITAAVCGTRFGASASLSIRACRMAALSPCEVRRESRVVTKRESRVSI